MDRRGLVGAGGAGSLEPEEGLALGWWVGEETSEWALWRWPRGGIVRVVGAERSPSLPLARFREEPTGFEVKEDYPLSKEELLSYVMKSVRRDGAAWVGAVLSPPGASLTPPPPRPPQMEAREQAREQHLKELMEMAKKMDSSPPMTLSTGPRPSSATPLAISRSPSVGQGAALSHRGNGILVSSRATSANVGHVTFGDPSAMGSASFSQTSSAGRVSFRPLSSSSYLGSTGYLESSGGPESLGKGTESELSPDPASSIGPGSTGSKES